METEAKNSYLNFILKLGIYIAAFVPLVIFAEFISPFHFGKVVVFRSIVEIMTAFYIVLIIKNKTYRPVWNPVLKTLLLFTFLFGLSSITSINPFLSFWGSLERMGGFWTFLHFFIYFLILTSVFRTKEDWLKLFKIMVFIGVLSAFYGFGQRTNLSFFIGSGGRARIFGTLGNAALFAGYQIINLFLALILVFYSLVPKKQKLFLFAAAIINTIAVLMTAVRGSILGMSAGFVVFAFLYFYSSKSQVAKKTLTGIIAVLVLFVGLSFVFKNSQFVKNSGYLSRITDFSLKTYTVQTRFWAWRAGLTGWKESPKTILLGWGPENFNVPFSKYFNPKFYRGSGSETLFDRAHNMFVEVLVTMGLLAFLAYVSIFFFIYRLLWQAAFKKQQIDKVLSIGLISLVTAYVIHNCFIFDTSANFLVFFTTLGFIVFITSDSSTAKEDSNGNKLSTSLKMTTAVLLIIAGFVVYKINILPAEANYTVTRAITRSWVKDFYGAVSKFKEAMTYDVPGKYEFRHQYAQYVLEYMSGKKVDQTGASIIKNVITEIQKNASETSQDYLPYLYLSRLYITLGKEDPKSTYNDLALENSRKALSISPTFVRTYYEVAQAYLNKKDYESAIKYFSDAVSLNPDVGLSYWYLGATYFEIGQTQKGLEAIDRARKAGYSLSEPDLLRLITINLKTNNFEKIAELYQSLIELKPNFAQYHASLAVAYSKIGKLDQAVAEARVAAVLDKSFEDQAKSFVKSLGREF